MSEVTTIDVCTILPINSGNTRELNQSQMQINGQQEALNLLTLWELPTLHSTFIENEISTRALKFITYEEICELIPKIGPRTIFSGMLSIWRREQGLPQTVIPTATYHSPVTVTKRSFAQAFDPLTKVENKKVALPKPTKSIINKTEKSFEDSQSETAWLEDTGDIYDDEDLLESIDDYGRGIEDQNSNEEFLESEIIHSKPIRPSTRNPNTSNLTPKQDTPKENIKYPRKMGKSGNIIVDYKDWDGEKLFVKNLLLESYEGKTALDFYKEHEYLDNKNRKAIVLVLVKAVVERRIKKYTSVLDYMSKQLVELFPTETAETYFVPHTSIKPEGRAHGALYIKYSNYTRKLRKLGLWTADFIKHELK